MNEENKKHKNNKTLIINEQNGPNALIKVKNTTYAKYEDLLLKREKLKKQAFHYQQNYIREFGDKILELFQLKMECVRKKKTIEFCQKALNFGENINQNQLQKYLQEEMAALQQQFDGMIAEHDAAHNATAITEYDLLKIKKIYRCLVKQMHPDINPMVEQSDALMDLWNRIVISYRCNDLKTLEELKILATKALAEMNGTSLELEIPNLDEKIQTLEQEIAQIISTDPYQYRYILEDSRMVQEKMNSLSEEIKVYQEYSAQLEQMMTSLIGKGVIFTWQMN